MATAKGRRRCSTRIVLPYKMGATLRRRDAGQAAAGSDLSLPKLPGRTSTIRPVPCGSVRSQATTARSAFGSMDHTTKLSGTIPDKGAAFT